jgi:hypothetical protein
MWGHLGPSFSPVVLKARTVLDFWPQDALHATPQASLKRRFWSSDEATPAASSNDMYPGIHHTFWWFWRASSFKCLLLTSVCFPWFLSRRSWLECCKQQSQSVESAVFGQRVNVPDFQLPRMTETGNLEASSPPYFHPLHSHWSWVVLGVSMKVIWKKL